MLNRPTAVVAALALAAALLTAGHPAAQAADPIYRDPTQTVPARVADLLARMSLDEKLGQMTMRDVKYPPVGPDAARDQLLGSMLSGGDSAPVPATAESWADMYDRYQHAARQTRLGIPLLYGVDAVHGHAGVYGATVFPHNIGLGATREPDNPSAMTSLITGLQGDSLAGRRSIMATAKHYVGDGGTLGGKDQGDTVGDDAALRKIHLPPFEEAVKRNVASVMVSYSSWNGRKMHGNETLIRDHLRAPRSAGGLGFQGIVITDWDGAEKVDGQIRYTETDVRQALEAGIDIFMVTDQYGDYLNAFRRVVGPNPDATMTKRLDDSVRRILTKKFELGLFERPYADRELLTEVGSAAHRAIAREAVQKSQVVLKNNGVLPLRDLAGRKLFVAGKTADNIGLQSGGWTINWQGGDGPITAGTSILQGIRNTAGPASTVAYDKQGNGIDSTYSVAIAVIGERPYAEGHGDRRDDELGLDPEDKAVLAKLKASGVPVVTVLVSGRPLLITEELPGMSALVASWLPGSEGQGVADVLFGAVSPTGKLPVSWARTAAQQPINAGDGKAPLFAYGHGLTYTTR
jgi:beta-glucosidase